MKKDVLITIKGIQKIDQEQDTTELFTHGEFYKKDGSFFITYTESETTGFDGSITTLAVQGNEKVTLIRSGAAKSHLIMERGSRSVGHYGTLAGELAIGVYGRSIESSLTEKGGDLFFSYSLDVNTSLVSENEVYVTVKYQ